jgi:hypothetical protein
MILLSPPDDAFVALTALRAPRSRSRFLDSNSRKDSSTDFNRIAVRYE